MRLFLSALLTGLLSGCVTTNEGKVEDKTLKMVFTDTTLTFEVPSNYENIEFLYGGSLSVVVGYGEDSSYNTVMIFQEVDTESFGCPAYDLYTVLLTGSANENCKTVIVDGLKTIIKPVEGGSWTTEVGTFYYTESLAKLKAIYVLTPKKEVIGVQSDFMNKEGLKKILGNYL